MRSRFHAVFKMKKKESESGQSLVEVVVALGVVAALAVALVTTSLVTQRASRTAKNNTQASKLAQERIEEIRALRDRKGFTELVNNTGAACRKLVKPSSDPVTWSLSAASPCPEPVVLDQTTFLRELVISDDSPSSPNIRVVTVTVSWTDPGGQQKVSNVTKLSNCVNPLVPC